MESKTKHRILGILVIAGLVVILLPFLQSGKEISVDTAAAKTPPFPDQSIQVTTTPTQSSTQTISIPIAASSSEEVKQQPDDTIKTDHTELKPGGSAPVINNPAVENHAITPEPPQSDKEQTHQSSDEMAAKKSEPKPNENNSTTTANHSVTKPNEKNTSVTKKLSKTKKDVRSMHAAMDGTILFKSHSPVWVIQVGSFKNKANALRVVNNLREKGYSAFIQQVSSTPGDNIRVFVGPESKQSAARELAETLESDMHLRGIVVSYKPLAL